MYFNLCEKVPAYFQYSMLTEKSSNDIKITYAKVLNDEHVICTEPSMNST